MCLRSATWRRRGRTADGGECGFVSGCCSACSSVFLTRDPVQMQGQGMTAAGSGEFNILMGPLAPGTHAIECHHSDGPLSSTGVSQVLFHDNVLTLCFVPDTTVACLKPAFPSEFPAGTASPPQLLAQPARSLNWVGPAPCRWRCGPTSHHWAAATRQG